MYSTEAEADTAARQGLARMLLAFSRLGVMMVGDLPSHAVASAFQPLHEAMLSGPWPNRHLLLLPLASASALVTQGAELARGTGVNVRTTPQVTRPADAWGFINGAWSRLRAEAAPAKPATNPAAPVARPSTAPTQSPAAAAPAPLPMRPMPPTQAEASCKELPAGSLERYVHHLSELAGMVSCCIFDVGTGRGSCTPGPARVRPTLPATAAHWSRQ
jgi:hypothetical protein